MNVLITGASGFTGHYMINHLLLSSDPGLHVWGVSRSDPQISHARFTYIRTDLSDGEQVSALISQVSPDAVIHLAGLNRGSLTELISANVINTDNLLRGVRDEKPDTRVLVIGSSAEYGYAGDRPLPEETPLRPIAPYGISKAAESHLALHYNTVYRLGVTIARPFNLVGPGQADSFICGRLARQAAEILDGTRKAFELEGGDARRDFIDVRDAVDAYWRLLSHENFHQRVAGHAFNVGSGKSYSVSEVIQEISVITGRKYQVQRGASPVQELVPVQIADITLIERETGWKPSTLLRRSLEEMIKYRSPAN